MKEKHQHHRHNWAGTISGGVFFISIGVLLMLNTTGAVDWAVWSILWRFWPVLLILGGIQMIFGKSLLTGILGGLINSLIIILVLLLAIVSVNDSEWVNSNFPWWGNVIENPGQAITTNLQVDTAKYPNVTKREFTFDLNAGNLTIGETTRNDVHLALTAEHHQDFGQPVLDENLSGETLKVDFSTKDENWTPFIFSPTKREYNFLLGQPNIPTSLDISLNAGSAEANLDNLNISSSAFRLNAGSLSITIADNVKVNGTMDVNLNAGSFELIMPKEIALHIVYESRAGSLNVDGQSLSGDGVYNSENAQTATSTLNMDIEMNAGSASISYN